jgi:hypothetical protein
MLLVLPGVFDILAKFFCEHKAFITLLFPTLDLPEKIISAMLFGRESASAVALKKTVFSNI